jgi:hypothetical protein
MSYTLPPDVVDFARAHLRSVADLQILLTCIDTRERWWDVKAISHQVGLAVREARVTLDHFVSANLLDIRVTDDVRYRFRPGTPEAETAALAFASAYKAHPVAVLGLIGSTARGNLRDFADAFRIRRDDDG